jgi:NADH dehydrogenase (ubiquinone) 1 alpha subcomplex subunit 8
MLCRKELQDPRKCISEGKAVTSCALEFFRKVKKTCFKEFTQYANCLDKSSTNFEFEQ